MSTEKDPPSPAPMQAGGNIALLVRVVTCVTSFAEGYDLGVFSGVLVLVRESFGLTPRQVGLVVASLYLAMAVGAPIGALIADRWGRKLGLSFTYVVLVIGCLVTALSYHFLQLFLGRVFLGVGIGAGICIVTTYITELAPKDRRGQYVGLEELFLIVGIAGGYAANTALAGVPGDWRWMVGLGIVPTLISLLTLMLPQLPESPRWLMMNGQGQEAAQALSSVVGHAEAAVMLEEWREEKASTWREVICPTGQWRRNAVFAGFGVWVLAMFTGINVMSVYISSIFAEEVPDEKAFQITSAVGFSRLVANTVAVFLLDGWGRRPMLLVSAAGMAASMALLAYLYAVQVPVLYGKALAFAAFKTTYSIGFGPAPWAYAAEVFPTDIRSKAMAVSTFAARTISGILTFTFPVAKQALGLPAVFGFFTLMNVFAFLFVACYLPETMGRSLEEMHSLFRGADDGPKSDAPPPAGQPPASKVCAA